MTVSLPYLASNKNLETLLAAIESAKIPERFTHEFLAKTIGLKGSNDRAVIPLLRTLGFIDQSGAPTSAYRLLKSKETAKGAVAAAVKKAYAPLFESNENANALAGDKLKGTIAQVAGTDSDMTARIAATFSALAKLGDFSAITQSPKEEENSEDQESEEQEEIKKQKLTKRASGLLPQFHYNIQVHLPANGTEDVYLSIFNALRKVFQ